MCPAWWCWQVHAVLYCQPVQAQARWVGEMWQWAHFWTQGDSFGDVSE